MATVKCLPIDDELHLTPLASESVPEACERPDARVWIDLQDLSSCRLHAQAKTNYRRAVLTVFSAIFMPLPRMAGIWGMNVETMPELKSAIGYPLALGGMALVGSGMYIFFGRRGWLD